MISTSAARATTVQREMSPRMATMIPSTTAIQRARRRRRSRSQRPARELPPSITGWLYAIDSTVPRWCGQPGTAPGREPLLRRSSLHSVEEETVDGRAGAADVSTEGAEAAQLVRQRRRGEVVRRKDGEITGPVNAREGVVQGLTALVEAAVAATGVEARIDIGRRGLRRLLRKDEQHPVVLREVERLQVGAVAGAELRPVLEEVRNVCAEPRGELVQPFRRERIVEQVIREAEGGGRVRAAASESGRDGDPLANRRGEPRLGSGGLGELGESTRDERVPGEAVDGETRRRLDQDPVGEGKPLVDREELVVAVLPARADDECEIELRRGSPAAHSRALASSTNSLGSSSSARTAGPRPIAPSAATAWSREARPASSSEFASVLRRWAKAPSTIVLSRR